jgi:hypothetical protein
MEERKRVKLIRLNWTNMRDMQIEKCACYFVWESWREEKEMWTRYGRKQERAGSEWHGVKYFLVIVGGLVVSILDNGPEVRRFKPGRERRFIRAIKIICTTSFGGKVKPSAPCRKILRHVKEPSEVWKRYFVKQNSSSHSPCSSCFYIRWPRWLCW